MKLKQRHLGENLLVNYFEFVRNRNNKPKKGSSLSSINWICAYNKIIKNKKKPNGDKYQRCKGSITVEVSTERITHFLNHTVNEHEEPLHESINNIDILVDEFHNKVKIRAEKD